MQKNLEVVFDTEVTMRCPVGNHKASPHWPDNKLICIAQTLNRGEDVTTHYNKDGFPPFAGNDIADTILVGQNIGFDIQWLLRMGAFTPEQMAKFTIWDTQLAEYVLSGQESRMISLDELCKKYGLPVKDDKVKAFWDAGEDTDAIPEKMLREYCEQDVRNTREIYRQQVISADLTGTFKLIMMLNGALLATTLMQYHGMKVDRSVLQRAANEAEKSLGDTEAVIRDKLGIKCFNLGSPAQVSAALFGGDIKEVVKEQDGFYKSGLRKGEPKFRNKEVIHTLYKQIAPEMVGSVKGKAGYYSTDDEVLQRICAHSGSTGASIASLILGYRKIDKQLNTYYRPILELLFPGDIIHHNLNATVTKTGRYSSSNPNLQNVTSGEDSEVKKAFVSRWGDDGVIVEADFKQLEIVALAILSGDKQLSKDLSDGVDMHTELYKQVYHKAPTYEERRQFKRAVFAAVYGAGPKRISDLTGMSTADSKKFVAAFEKRYPHVVTFRRATQDYVLANRRISDRRGPTTGLPLGVSQIQQPTGRILTFHEYEPNGTWKKHADFSWNDICNYPIQSFATGDLVPLYLDKLSRTIYGTELFNGKVVLVNTVHDSVVLDCKKEVLEVLKNTIKDVAANMKQYVKEDLGMELTLPLNIEVSSGPNWAEQKE